MADKKDKTKINIELDENTSKEVKDLSAYLKKKGITATDSEIVMAAIKLARQLGAGNWTFVCELGRGNKQNGR